MQKPKINLTLKQSTFEFIAMVAEINHTSRSNAVELISDMVQDYFTDNQISTEHRARGVVDYRRKEKKSE